MDRMFHADTGFTDPRAFNPSCEFTEEKDKYVARFEVPGVPKDQIKIEVHENTLTVSGEKKEEKKEDSKKRHYSEFSYGSFFRTFTLPSKIDAEKVAATYDHGILTVTMAKTEAAKARQITVK